MRKLIPLLIVGLLAFAAGCYLIYQFTGPAKEEKNVEATVLLEKVRQVFKLVTIEGQFSEVYNEDNYREITLYLPIPTKWRFSKSALLQVQGKVLVGYDLNKVSITVDSLNQTVSVNNLPAPEILAIDHSIVYRDLEESFFNKFSPEDYTQLNKNAKDVLRIKAKESGLIEQAQGQGQQVLQGLRFMVEGAGYQLKIPGDIDLDEEEEGASVEFSQ